MNNDNFNQEGHKPLSFDGEPYEYDPDYDHKANPQNVREQGDRVITKGLLDELSKQIAQRMTQSLTPYLSPQKSYPSNHPSDFENEVLRYLKVLYNGTVYTDSSNTLYFSNQKIMSDLANALSMINTLNEQVGNLSKLAESQNATIAEQASIIKKQHEAIARFESDVIYKTQKDLIMELIGISDQLKITISDYSSNPELNLLDAMVQLEEWVNGSLQAVAVRKYMDVESKELDRKRQEVIEVQETNIPEEDGMLKSILPGYVWSVPMVGSNEMLNIEDKPRKFEFMIRPEQMARLHYSKSSVETSANVEASANVESSANAEASGSPDDLRGESEAPDPETSAECIPDAVNDVNSEVKEPAEPQKPAKVRKGFWSKRS